MRGLTNVIAATILILTVLGIGIYAYYTMRDMATHASPHGSILSLGAAKVVKDTEDNTIYVSVVATNAGTGPVTIVYPILIVGINVSQTPPGQEQSPLIACVSDVPYSGSSIYNCILIDNIDGAYIYLCRGGCPPYAVPLALVNGGTSSNQEEYSKIELEPTGSSPRYIPPLSVAKIVATTSEELPTADLILIVVPYRYGNTVFAAATVLRS